ncbi:hypothetical protein CV770_30345 [Bradyrhizobium sp. AC87j1]|nr:hypothetical protein CV770_30345 [Bradyrhizobium sp. AC87j1]
MRETLRGSRSHRPRGGSPSPRKRGEGARGPSVPHDGPQHASQPHGLLPAAAHDIIKTASHFCFLGA